MNREQAFELMKSSNTVLEWNANRVKVKRLLEKDSNYIDTIALIDGRALIIETLGKDYVPLHISKFTKKEVGDKLPEPPSEPVVDPILETVDDTSNDGSLID